MTLSEKWMVDMQFSPPLAAKSIEEAIEAEIPLVVWFVSSPLLVCPLKDTNNSVYSITEGIPQHGENSWTPLEGYGVDFLFRHGTCRQCLENPKQDQISWPQLSW